MGKSKKSDYIILALICLIILNIGSMLIGFYTTNKQDLNIKANNRILSLSFNYIKSKFNLDMSIILKKTINSLYPIAEVLHEEDMEIEIENNNIIPTFQEIDEKEDNKEMDIIIENLDEYDSLIIIKDTHGIHQVENVPEPLMLKKIKVDKETPYILMYHTHATESYLIAQKEDYRTSVRDYNVVGMGDIISTVLEANNHKVNHVDTYHDLPSYNQSYSRSLSTIRKNQEESSNFKILMDVHRNAVKDDHPQIEKIIAKSKTEIDGKSVATFSLVVGPDSENYEEVLSFAKYIKAVSDALYPNLCTEIIIKPIGKYNQHLSDYSVLIELGYHLNTVEEAREGAKLVGEILSIVLNSIIEE